MRRMLCGIATLLALASSAGADVAGTSRFALPPPLDAAEFQPFDEKRAALGQLLFYDKILSGNRNIACGTCHNHAHGSSDGLSLGIGEGGIGLGPKRRIPEGRDHPDKRVPRNASALFNLGHRDFRILFHDGRASIDDLYGNGFNTPAEEWLPKGLTSIAAAQAMFPVTAEIEMAGDAEENEIAASRRERIDHVWPIIARRVSAIAAYVEAFRAAYPDIETPGDITMVHIANAIGDFIIGEWRTVDSPFDRYLKGDERALTGVQKAGLGLFYGKAGCAGCHSGPLLTDQDFHALAIPPFGPGRLRPYDPFPRDVGRMGETDRLEDAYRFRTPSLRNVTETGPWGHNGAYATLEGIVRHHLDPLAALSQWDRTQVILPASARFPATDFAVWEDAREMERLRSHVDIAPVALGDADVTAILAFLESLTDDGGAKGWLGKPANVPSGLSID
jgi:cytochrome c peroxidase